MRLRRTGTYRSRGIDTLARTDKILSMRWESGPDTLSIWVRGLEGSTTHRYGIELSASELADMVEAAIVQASRERSTQAIAKGIGAYIRSILATPPPTPIQSDADEE